MSDYMFMLESHLGLAQARALEQVQAAATDAGMALFLTGGAMRDMLGGFPVRDLDFTVDGDALKLAKTLKKKGFAELLSADTNRHQAELIFQGDASVEISMARTERFVKPGGKPHVQPATIHEDLLRRDFTVNAIALSLNRASRGLLLDPNNGLADLERRELRATSSHALFDDPIRLLRLIRLKSRLAFGIEERTQAQYERAREAKMETRIGARCLLQEVRSLAAEPAIDEVLGGLKNEDLLGLLSPALASGKLSLPAFSRLQKAKDLITFGAELPVDSLSLFLHALTEKFTPREKTELAKTLGLGKPDRDAWKSLESRAKKLERELKSPKLHRPSAVYRALRSVPGEVQLFLYLHTNVRLVHDRIRNHLQKYLATALEFSDDAVAAYGVEPGTPKFEKHREELIAARLDGKKVKSLPAEAKPA